MSSPPPPCLKSMRIIKDLPGPGVFHTYPYNHAQRFRLDLTNILYLELSIIEAPTGILNHFWIRGGFRSETSIT